MRLAVIGTLALAAAAALSACAGDVGPATSSIIATHTQAPSTVTPTPSPPIAEPYPRGAVGFAISWPQCGAGYPEPPFAFGIIGVTNGSAMTRNPCFADEYRWAERGRYPPAIYLNTNYRETEDANPYHYGREVARLAYEYAEESNALASTWWLGVQIVSEWSDDPTLNAASIFGSATFLESKGIRVGISSTSYQWAMVAGIAQHNRPVWDASASDVDEATAFCDGGKDFGGGPTELIAWVDGYETVLACGVVRPPAR